MNFGALCLESCDFSSDEGVANGRIVICEVCNLHRCPIVIDLADRKPTRPS